MIIFPPGQQFANVANAYKNTVLKLSVIVLSYHKSAHMHGKAGTGEFLLSD